MIPEEQAVAARTIGWRGAFQWKVGGPAEAGGEIMREINHGYCRCGRRSQGLDPASPRQANDGLKVIGLRE